MTKEDSNKIIELYDVSFSYGEHEVLSCINLTVAKGDYLGIIGPNGAGKTTLLKIILGLLTPTKGSVIIFGKDQAHLRQRSLIGYVPQKTSSFDANFPATAFEVVLMGRYAERGLLHMVTHEDREAAEHALREVNMWEERAQLIGNLSGGQQQRVFIARALVSLPKILFLDEPTSGIDHAAQKDFYALLRKLRTEEELTIVLVSHDIGTIAKEASRLAYVDATLSYYPSPLEFIATDTRNALTHGHDH